MYFLKSKNKIKQTRPYNLKTDITHTHKTLNKLKLIQSYKSKLKPT